MDDEERLIIIQLNKNWVNNKSFFFTSSDGHVISSPFDVYPLTESFKRIISKISDCGVKTSSENGDSVELNKTKYQNKAKQNNRPDLKIEKLR